MSRADRRAGKGWGREMIELGGGRPGGAGGPGAPGGAAPGAAPGAAQPIAFDTSDATFVQDVVQASMQGPIIAVMAPRLDKAAQDYIRMLERELAAYRGAIRLAKLDSDQNPMVPSQLGATAFPMTVAFAQGQGLAGFPGAPGPAQIKDFLGRIAEAMGIGGAEGGADLDQALDMADKMLAEGALEDAFQTYAAVAGEDGENGRAIAGMARALIALGRPEEAQQALDLVPPVLVDDPEIKAVRAQLALAANAGAAGEVAALHAALEATPDDHETRLKLADALIGQGDNEGAIDALLELFRRDREWNDGAAKTRLLTLIESLGPKDPLAGRARRRLSSLIFA